MGIFKKLFGKKSSDLKHTDDAIEESKYMPDKKLPSDERFAVNFKANGGKFIYCENTAEAQSIFNNIVEENGWENQNVLVYNPSLKSLITKSPVVNTATSSKSTFFFTACENLIADDGSILISSNQIAEKRLNELPQHFIVYATTSQIVNTISDGLSGIKNKNRKRIPVNITTIKCFGLDNSQKDSFLNYGRSRKNLYLILQEDL